MMVKIGMTVVEQNNITEKVKERYVESDTLLGITRLMLTWKPFKGHSVIQFRVEEVGRLI